MKWGVRMRYGFTTGSYSAAAAKAAAYMLLSGRKKTEIEIRTPKGILFQTAVLAIQRSEHIVSCAVKKDAGDDPDVTDGVLVYAKVTTKIPKDFLKCEESIIIEGGIGVGRVTKRGLDQPVGAAAINHVPREMIRKEVAEVLALFDYKSPVYVEISIPEGVALAKQTFNPRLGIVGGISVLGTTGIVEPMSERALLDTIKTELSVKRAEGGELVSISPGNYGLDFLKRTYGFDLDTSVKCSNFIGNTIDMVVELGFSKLLLCGHLGKLIKVSGGIMNTHSREGDCRMELLAAAAIQAKVPEDTLLKILQCATTEEAVNVIDVTGKREKVMEIILEKILFYLNKRAKDRLQIEVILYTNEHGELVKSSGAETFMQMLK